MSYEVTIETGSIPPMAIEAINQISGAYSAPFWDMVYAMCENVEAVQNIGYVMKLLHLEGKNKEDMLLIHALYDMIGFNYPAEIALLEEHENAQEIFVREFLLDHEDLMHEYMTE